MKPEFMDKKIFSCFISLAFCLLIAYPLQAQNRNNTVQPKSGTNPPKKDDKEVAEEKFPLYNGISVGVDLFGIGNKVFGGDNISSEIIIDVNLKNRFFPVLELGYGQTDTWGNKGIHYKTGAPYFRIGADYNFLFKKKFKNYLFGGIRYAMSSFKYDIQAMPVDDPIWGGSINNPSLEDGIWGGSLPFDHQGMKGSMQWLEICAGIRAHIWKDLYMGWAVRFKYRLSSSTGTYGDPSYVPGFGEYSSNTIGVTYTITYKLPF